MLKLQIKPSDFYDENKEEFITSPGLQLELEHSLYTISKWESRWMKPFMGTTEKTNDEVLDYILCMDVSNNLTLESLHVVSQEDLTRILTYIESNMSATTFSNIENTKPNREIVTSELIYYWMISLQIPLECEHWHLNRLMTLIKICNIKNSPPKKQNKQAVMNKQKELNKQRRMQNNSAG